MASEYKSYNQHSKITIVIRSSGERSIHACKNLVLQQDFNSEVHFVNEFPFESAIRKSYEIGLDAGNEWLMTLDADVLLREGAVTEFLSHAQNLPGNYFQIEGLVFDKLTGTYRKAGHRMYRTSFLKIALKQIPRTRTKIRPEFTTLMNMEALGYPSREINSVFGIHDYEQYYRDIYRKAYIHANKHQNWLPELIKRWKTMSTFDDDFRIALRGLYDGLMYLSKPYIDSRAYNELAYKAMYELSIEEKLPLNNTSVNFDYVYTILKNNEKNIQKHPTSSLNNKIGNLYKRYHKVGALKFILITFGYILCDIGNAIKRSFEKGSNL